MSELGKYLSLGKRHHFGALEKHFPDISLVTRRGAAVAVYGAGRLGRTILANLRAKGVKVVFFVDGNRKLWGTSLDGVEIRPPACLRGKGLPIVVASLLHEAEICAALQKKGCSPVYPLGYLNYARRDIFPTPGYDKKFDSLFAASNRKEILAVEQMLADKKSLKVFSALIKFRTSLDRGLLSNASDDISLQYYDKKVIPFKSAEVFLDCGAYDGDSMEKFCTASAGKFRKIYCFEPDAANYARMSALAKKIAPKKIVPVKAGVYSKTGEVGFIEAGTIDSQIGNGPSRIPVVSIDDFLEGKEAPTFIKMDIEGSEIDALRGARKALANHKPKLAISIYHTEYDLWKIPMLIKQLNPAYRIFIRQYSDGILDTICYAV